MTTAEPDVASLEAILTDVVVAIDRQLVLMGRGRPPSPRLQRALDTARDLVPTIPAQTAPRSEP